MGITVSGSKQKEVISDYVNASSLLHTENNGLNINVLLNDPEIRKAASIVMKHYKDRAFAEMIINVDKFNHTDHSPIQVALCIESEMNSLQVDIKTYKSLNPWSKAVAYAEGNTIYFNNRRSAGLIDRAGTIMHECMHLIGYKHKGNNLSHYNIQTVPYKVQMLFERYLQGIY
jgi:hypothetical protein